jgi:hypothetical protein
MGSTYRAEAIQRSQHKEKFIEFEIKGAKEKADLDVDYPNRGSISEINLDTKDNDMVERLSESRANIEEFVQTSQIASSLHLTIGSSSGFVSSASLESVSLVSPLNPTLLYAAI